MEIFEIKMIKIVANKEIIVWNMILTFTDLSFLYYINFYQYFLRNMNDIYVIFQAKRKKFTATVKIKRPDKIQAIFNLILVSAYSLDSFDPI